MIDEKEVIEAIEEKILEVKADKEKCEVIFDFADILMAIYRELIYFIDKQPRLGEWIPCSKQLPEMHKVPLDYDEYYMISDSVLVTDGNSVFISEYEADDDYCYGWFNDGDKCKSEITHWMPLPKPYKPEAHGTKKQTNADRIRNMSDEELADFIEMKQFFALARNGTDGEDFTLKWLQSEVEE